MDPVKTRDGYISGTLRGEPGNEVHIYRGIPYAAAPIGDLRWRPPQPVKPWSKIRECTVYSMQAAQFPDVNVPEERQKVPTSEDCLYLNVTTPAKTAKERLPVMVWFHGGGLRYGSGNWTLYNRLELPRNGVIVVTVNTRLGVMGLLSHPLLSRESPDGVSGNYLCLDMIASLQWVKENIAAFGGDPDNVTIFGESGGSIKVVNLLASPLAKGLFHRAIGQSGGGMDPLPMEEMEVFGEKLFKKLGVDKESDPLAAARTISWEKIIELDQAMNKELGEQYVFLGPWNIVIDDRFLNDSPANTFKAGKQNPVPFILLANMGELTGPGYVQLPQLIPAYSTLLSNAGKVNVKGYAGIFDQMPSNWREEGGVASHALEMHYVFGALDDDEAWKTLFSLYASGGAKSPTPLITDADRNVSEQMMTVWTQFAKTGDPNVEGMITWPVYEEKSEPYLYIAEPLGVRFGFSKILVDSKKSLFVGEE